MGERKFAQMILVKWPRWLPGPLMIKKTLKSSPSEPIGRCH